MGPRSEQEETEARPMTPRSQCDGSLRVPAWLRHGARACEPALCWGIPKGVSAMTHTLPSGGSGGTRPSRLRAGLAQSAEGPNGTHAALPWARAPSARRPPSGWNCSAASSLGLGLVTRLNTGDVPAFRIPGPYNESRSMDASRWLYFPREPSRGRSVQTHCAVRRFRAGCYAVDA